MTYPTDQSTITKLIEEKAERIEQAVRRAMPKSDFRIRSIQTEQAKRAAFVASDDSLHADWDSLDSGCRSSACRLEHARLILFLLVYIIAALKAADGKAFHVIIADKRWQVRGDQLHPHIFDRPRRKLRRAMQLLRANGVSPVFVAANELSAARNLDGTYPFEPHIHLLVVGATREQLKLAFKVRQHRSERGKAKPVRVVRVKKRHIAGVIGYLSKIKPQERVEYIRKNGKRNRTTNRMHADYLPLWVLCMSQIPITQLIEFGGFSERMSVRFANCEMATLIGDL